ncbi:MAG: hypothetical protein FJY55_09020 [Betaproteobacteria bacterium]|nr:hypothetical protein [Betaproteobacteria bacterium]
MAHTYTELKHKTLAELKGVAAEISPAVEGYTQMNKDHLLVAICKALDIDMHVHLEVKGIDKAAVKVKIREWKAKRDEAITARDHKALKFARNHIRAFKRRLRKAISRSA